MTAEKYDFILIGAGIVGASTAMQLIEAKPNAKILLLDKEPEHASHQTGHNSGVIHAGVYYKPGSLKAEFCKRGLRETIRFCQEHSIPYEQCGKVIVATKQSELNSLTDLFQNCKTNGLDVYLLEKPDLKKIEPNIQGLKGILVKDSGITDYIAITAAMISAFEEKGGEFQPNSKITKLEELDGEVTIELESGSTMKSSFLVACAGLQADRIASMMRIDIDFKIVPFKGEYFKLPDQKSGIVKHLIYPVPDPSMPFLGVHLTKMIDGSTTVGPNAILSLNREGYKKLSVNCRDIASMLTFKGFWKVITKNLTAGISEIKNSVWKPGYLKLVQRYCPSIGLSDLRKYPPGIRAQAVTQSGELVHDFLFKETSRSLHVCNAPSPAATSAIPIGEHIVKRILELESNLKTPSPNRIT